MFKPVIIFCVALLAVGVGLGFCHYAAAGNSDNQGKVLAGIKNDVDIDGDNIPDKISLVRSSGNGAYDLVARLSKFRKQIVLTSIEQRHIQTVNVSIMNKKDHLGYLLENRWLSDAEKRLIRESKALGFVDVTYQESSAFIVLIAESGEPTRMFYSD